MRTKPFIIKALVFFVFAALTAALISSPAYAWKVKTHVYSANLIMEEMKANNGYVEIKPYGKFKVIPEYRTVIEAYPEYYRAGAMGPDVFPDIIVGQTVIHPGTKVFTSGEIIEILWDEIKNLPATSTPPANDPAGKYLRINNRQQAEAFVLGCIAHAAGDYFGHSYVNNWSGGAWPDITDGINPEEMGIIIRHNVVEAYIDDKIPSKYKSEAYNTIKIPQVFVFDNMLTGGTVNTEVLANDSRNAKRFGNADDVPMHLKLFFDLRSDLRNSIIQIDRNMKGDVLDVAASYLTLEFAQKAYMQAWIEDIDEGLGDWVAANERAAQKMLTEGMGAYKEELSKWAEVHLLEMLGAPDVVGETIRTIGNISEFVDGLLPDFFSQYIEALKRNFVNTLFRTAFKIDYDQLVVMLETPATYFDKTDIFPSGSLTKLNQEMGNFNTCTNAVDQSFMPFQNTLTLMKLALIGQEGIDELRRIAGSNSNFKLDHYTDTLTEFIISMDKAYDWKDQNQELTGFLLWQSVEDRSKISKVIFNLNGTTQKPSFSNMSKGPISITPGPRTAGTVPNISVSYSNAPDQVNAVIGLYPADNFSAKAESWQFIAGKTSGSYSVTTPFKGGKYHFRIYDDNNQLLAVSDTIEVLEKDGMAEFTEISSTQLTPDEIFTFTLLNPQKKTGFYALYKEAETDPAKPIFKKSDLNGKATTISANLYAPEINGRYQLRAYDSNNNLLAKSPVLVVSGGVPAGPSEPGVPANNSVLTLKATSGAGFVKLDWNAITDAKEVTGYYIYKSTVSGKQSSTPETDFSITAVTYTDTKLQPGTTYYYIIKPVYKDGSMGPASNEVSASPGNKYGIIELTLGNPYMKVNGVSREIDPGNGTAPETMEGRTCLPIRAVAEAMGATVGWENSTKKCTLVRGDITVELWIGKKIVRVNGEDQTIDVAPYTSKTGRTMIPLRFAGESLGAVITWDNTTKTATIVYEDMDAAEKPAEPVIPKEPKEPDPVVDSTGWAGVWFTEFGRMEITVNGSSVTGIYGMNKHKIKGTISGNVLTGTYTENGYTGNIRFVLAKDGKSFDGVYDEDSDWNGARDYDPNAKYLRVLSKPADFTGTWETDFGTLVIRQNGNSVTGTYDYTENCVITGTVENNKLTGRYYERKGSPDEFSGLIEFYLLEDTRYFQGLYGDDQTARQDWSDWNGER